MKGNKFKKVREGEIKIKQLEGPGKSVSYEDKYRQT